MQVAVWFALSLSKLVYSEASQIEHPVREYFLWSGDNERLQKKKKKSSLEFLETIVINILHDPKPTVGWICM